MRTAAKRGHAPRLRAYASVPRSAPRRFEGGPNSAARVVPGRASALPINTKVAALLYRADPRRTATRRTPLPTTEQIQHLLQPLFPGLMGVEIKEATPERVVASMLVRPDLCTAGGVCHGGAFMAFADTIGAVGTVMNLAPGTRTTTIESKTNFLGAAP